MKINLKQIIKKNNFLNFLYYYIGSFIINIIKVFIKPDDKLILFVSFSGRQFSDSPKVIYEYMLSDSRFKDYKLVWAFTNPDDYNIGKGHKIKIDTLKYFVTALKARVWITNSGIERLLNFKGKKTLYVNTWHGVPIKKLGKDQQSINKIERKWYELSCIDIMVAETEYDRDILSRIFNINKDKFKLIGLPRNDELLKNKDLNIDELKKKFNIPLNKKVILYAPTFREYINDSNYNILMAPPIDFGKWKKYLGDEYIILFRAHYFVDKIVGVNNDHNDFIIDVTNYNNINELMLVSDILISDYSSLFFDYSLLEKPMFCYAYDYDEYCKKRGLYMDIKNELPNGVVQDEDKLLQHIKNMDYKLECEKTKCFKVKYTCGCGNATEKLVKYIIDKLRT